MSRSVRPHDDESQPAWVPEPTRATRRLAAEVAALGFAWRVSPPPLKIAVLAAVVHLAGVDSRVLEILRLIA